MPEDGAAAAESFSHFKVVKPKAPFLNKGETQYLQVRAFDRRVKKYLKDSVTYTFAPASLVDMLHEKVKHQIARWTKVDAFPDMCDNEGVEEDRVVAWMLERMEVPTEIKNSWREIVEKEVQGALDFKHGLTPRQAWIEMAAGIHFEIDAAGLWDWKDAKGKHFITPNRCMKIVVKELPNEFQEAIKDQLNSSLESLEDAWDVVEEAMCNKWAVAKRETRKTKKDTRKEKRSCHYCGGRNHIKAKCKSYLGDLKAHCVKPDFKNRGGTAEDAVGAPSTAFARKREDTTRACHGCGATDHLVKDCTEKLKWASIRKRRMENVRGANMIEESSTSSVHGILVVEGVSVEAYADGACDCDCLSAAAFAKLPAAKQAEAEETDTRVRGAGDALIEVGKVLRDIQVHIPSKGHFVTDLHIVRSSRPRILVSNATLRQLGVPMPEDFIWGDKTSFEMQEGLKVVPLKERSSLLTPERVVKRRKKNKRKRGTGGLEAAAVASNEVIEANKGSNPMGVIGDAGIDNSTDDTMLVNVSQEAVESVSGMASTADNGKEAVEEKPSVRDITDSVLDIVVPRVKRKRRKRPFNRIRRTSKPDILGEEKVLSNEESPSTVLSKPESEPATDINQRDKDIQECYMALERFQLGVVEERESEEYKSAVSRQELPSDYDIDIFTSVDMYDVMKHLEEKGCPKRTRDALRGVVDKHFKVWYANISEESKVAKFEAHVRDGPPIRYKARPLNHNKLAFLVEHTKKLIGMNVIEQVHGTSPEVIVPIVMIEKGINKETGKLEWRVCLDLRPVNLRTEKTSFPVPLLPDMREAMRGCTRFATLDLLKGFWQVPIEEESKKYFTFITPIGKYRLNRMPMGACNASNHMQSVMMDLLRELDNVIVFQDDILIGGQSDAELVEQLDAVLNKLDSVNMRLQLGKVNLWSKEAVFVGHLFTSRGVTADPKKIAALLDAQRPVIVKELRTLIYSSNFSRNYLVKFGERVVPLQRYLTETLKGLEGANLTRAVKKKIVWTPELIEAFEVWRRMLADHILCSYRKEDHAVFTVSDASADGYGWAVCQCPKEQPLGWEMKDLLGVEFLAMGSGMFTGSQLNWSTRDKEGYGLMEPFMKSGHLLETDDDNVVRVYTDHRNLKYMLLGTNSPSTMAKERLTRWGIELSRFHVEIMHTSGEDNGFADFMSRGAHSREHHEEYCAVCEEDKEDPQPCKEPCDVFLIEAIESDINAGANEDMHNIVMGRWVEGALPGRLQIQESQDQYFEAMTARSRRKLLREGLVKDRGEMGNMRPIYVKDDGEGMKRVWIPSGDEMLLVQLIACSHGGGLSGHRSQQHTVQALEDKFWDEEDHLGQMAREFVQSCMYCMKSDPRSMIPREWGHHIVPEKPNDVVTWDFYDVTHLGECGLRYLLVMKDRLSGFVELAACADEDAFTAAQCLLEWIGRFGPPKILLSDNGTHFKAGIVAQVCQGAHVEQMFTTAYIAWSNGCVEAVNRQITRLLRVLMAENRHEMTYWPHLITTVQALINNRQSARLDGRAPIEVMTGLPRSEVLDSVLFRDEREQVQWENIPVNSELVTRYVIRLTERLNEAYRACVSSQESRRIVNDNRRKKKAVHLELNVGDYVFAAIPHKGRGRKLTVQWKGPFEVVGLKNPRVALIKIVVGEDPKVLEMHFSKMKRFRTAGAHLMDQWVQQAAYDDAALVIEEIQDCRLSDEDANGNPRKDRIEFKVKWYSIEMPTWETSTAVIDEDPSEAYEVITRWKNDRRRTAAMRRALEQLQIEEFGLDHRVDEDDE